MTRDDRKDKEIAARIGRTINEWLFGNDKKDSKEKESKDKKDSKDKK